VRIISPTCNAGLPNLTNHTYVPPRLTEWEDESPYPEVRAAVSNTDDMEMPADTLRAWTIGLFWAIFIPGLNQFFHFRYPSVTIGSVRRPFLPPPPYVNPDKGVGCCWIISDVTLHSLSPNFFPFPSGARGHAQFPDIEYSAFP
jgi:hypothetical protein